MVTRLTFDLVSAELTALGIPHTVGPEGFDLPDGWALRQGCGAAGRGCHFFLWHLPSDSIPAAWPTVGTPSALRRILRAWRHQHSQTGPSDRPSTRTVNQGG